MNSNDDTTIKNCRIIQLDSVRTPDACYSTSVEGCDQLPYEVQRVYYLYEAPAGAKRGGHSHTECQEFLVAVSGKLDVIIDDGSNTRRVTLNRPNQGLLIATGIWRTLKNFSSGAVCLVLASHPYDESDYIRQYSAFLKSKNKL